MSDAAQPPHSPENIPAEGASSEGAATGETVGESPANGTPARVPMDKPPAGPASDGTADSGVEPDPWAAPAADARGSGSAADGPRRTMFRKAGDADPPLPSVHNHPTVTSTPAGTTPPPAAPAAQASQPWANPFAPPGGPVAGVPQDNPFAPPTPQASYARPAAPGGPVPPPPIAPDGPGQAPYAYPSYPTHPSGAGYGYPQQSGYAGSGPGYPAPPMYGGGPGYGWAPMAPQPMNGMGTASLVVGIISAVFFCLWPLAIILGILAVVFGLVARQRARRGQATNPGQALAGIICGAVGIVIAVAFGVLIIAFGEEGSADNIDGSYSTVLSQQVQD
ncbi:DUF4190 domain-containing protein [Streptomyces sp. NBC_00576]|uniref:DUF4190 domain-containing protein n=1 Tax=Streptomyces sp. NBC_00576 TaxID=2903665 RepID=UPI002E7FDDDE|nr:DUF4190 domain-containing protein [Streptomyces sp. NBC_00576]WUB70756.1 DUF4190 domain-containing protein [Streptomyces sp. NBC_00576]